MFLPVGVIVKVLQAEDRHLADLAPDVDGVPLASCPRPEVGGLAFVGHFHVFPEPWAGVPGSKDLRGCDQGTHLLVVAFLFNVLQSLWELAINLFPCPIASENFRVLTRRGADLGKEEQRFESQLLQL